MISWRHALPNFFSHVMHFFRPRINHILERHIRLASTSGSGMMWAPLSPLGAQRPTHWGKEGYFFIYDGSVIEVWRCENWEAHMVSLSLWNRAEEWN